MNGVSSAGRGPQNRRSQASDPIDVTTDRCLSVSRKPTARTNPEMPASASWTAASPPSSMVTTRKIAAGVNGPLTGCGSGSGISWPYYQKRPLFVWPSRACSIHHAFQNTSVAPVGALYTRTVMTATVRRGIVNPQMRTDATGQVLKVLHMGQRAAAAAVSGMFHALFRFDRPPNSGSKPNAKAVCPIALPGLDLASSSIVGEAPGPSMGSATKSCTKPCI
jgi:hypothetical protein